MSGGVRPATAADLETVAAIHTQAWREAYAGLIPEPAATGMSFAARVAMWRPRFEGEAAGRGLWVLAVNAGAIAFYRRLGALPGPTQSFAIGSVSLVETAMLWPDLAALAARA